MRFVGSAMGISAIQLAADDVMPSKGLLQSDLISFIAQKYSFLGRPEVQDGGVLNFQSGAFVRNEERFPIVQMTLLRDGDLVTANDTDTADIILQDLLNQLNTELGYRYRREVVSNRLYVSALVVEFEDSFVKRLDPLSQLREAFSPYLADDANIYKLKRLGFGKDSNPSPLNIIGPSPTVSDMLYQDFVIERRAGVPLERNFFFSSAPLKTSEHMKMLEQIERSLMS